MQPNDNINLFDSARASAAGRSGFCDCGYCWAGWSAAAPSSAFAG